MVIVTVAGQNFHVKKNLMDKWDKIKDGKLKKIDDDKVYVVDGRERAGKSLFTLQQAAAIDSTIILESLETKKLDRVCFTGEETLKAIRQTKSTDHQTKVVIFDEAFRGLASSSVLSKTNRIIVQALMEMGQNNLVLFIVLPSFFLLDRYPAVLRSNALFHIEKYKKNHKKRKFKVYNFYKKAYLYHLGIKKGWGYPTKTRIIGDFFGKYPGGDEFEKLYRKKKEMAFREIESKLTGEIEESKPTLQRNILFMHCKERHGEKWTELSKLFEEKTIRIHPNSIGIAVNRTKDWLRRQKNDK